MLIEVCFRPECINLQVLYGIPEVKKISFYPPQCQIAMLLPEKYIVLTSF